jgi:hypothetical protein
MGLVLFRKQNELMKALIFSIGISFVLIACNNNKDYGAYQTAVDNARNYLRSELGDAANYEEISWGTPEPRKMDWKTSDRYKLYHDTIVMMQDHLKMMNDSLEAELRLSGAESPAYKTLRLRRDGYQMYFTTYSNEVERMKMYESDPEYRGYWIYHEYNMDGTLKRVRIIFDDTLNWTASELIYVE